MGTACDRLFGEASGQPLDNVLELARGGRVTQRVVAAAARSAGGLRAAAETSPVELEARLLLVADETDTRVMELRRGGSIDIDRTALVAAGLDVVRACEQGRSASGLAQQTTQVTSGAAQTTIPGDGTFLVGQDVVAGTYRSEGASSTDDRECVAYASRESGDIRTFVRGSTSTGPAFLLLNAGEYVTTMFCQPFNIQG